MFTGSRRRAIMSRTRSARLPSRHLIARHVTSTACHDCRSLRRHTRRDVLRAGTLSLFGLTMPDLLLGRDRLHAAAGTKAANPVPPADSFGRARSCILLFMWGGPAHQDTWDLKPEAPAEIRGEFKPISTVVPGIDVCEHFPLLARRTDKLAIVRSMTHADVNHTTATHYLLTGQPSPPLSDDLR